MGLSTETTFSSGNFHAGEKALFPFDFGPAILQPLPFTTISQLGEQ